MECEWYHGVGVIEEYLGVKVLPWSDTHELSLDWPMQDLALTVVFI